MEIPKPHPLEVIILSAAFWLIVLAPIALILYGIIRTGILPCIKDIRAKRRFAANKNDLEMQDITGPAMRRSYDSDRDGFEETPVYGCGAGDGVSLMSFTSFVEAGFVGKRGSVDTLAGMDDMVSPGTIPAPPTFVDVRQPVENGEEGGDEFAAYVVGEEEPEDAACEGEPEVAKREFEQGPTSPVSPIGLGISVVESDIQAQLSMLEGRSSAEDVWSCEVVEAFERV